MTGSIRLPREIRDAVITHTGFCHPYEACGLFAVDSSGAIRFFYACTNRAASRTRFVVDPTEHFRAIQHAESLGWAIGGAFHSHPDGDAVPSATDVAEALDPTWFHVLVAGNEIRAWRIDGAPRELGVEVVT